MNLFCSGLISNLNSCIVGLVLEMKPDPTRAYFWPAVNKRPTHLWPGYFLTQLKENFFDPRGKKLTKFDVFRENFQIQTQTINGWRDPGQKFLTLNEWKLLLLKKTSHNFISYIFKVWKILQFIFLHTV